MTSGKSRQWHPDGGVSAASASTEWFFPHRLHIRLNKRLPPPSCTIAQTMDGRGTRDAFAFQVPDVFFSNVQQPRPPQWQRVGLNRDVQHGLETQISPTLTVRFSFASFFTLLSYFFIGLRVWTEWLPPAAPTTSMTTGSLTKGFDLWQTSPAHQYFFFYKFYYSAGWSILLDYVYEGTDHTPIPRWRWTRDRGPGCVLSPRCFFTTTSRMVSSSRWWVSIGTVTGQNSNNDLLSGSPKLSG